MSKPTVVIVPGAWQKPVAWDGFVRRLQKAGYEAVHVALPTVGGTVTPLASLAEDVAAVRAVLGSLAEQGKKALVLCHSSGGLVGSNAVPESSNVIGLVFLSAFMIPKGQAVLDMLGGQPLQWMDIQGDRTLGVPEMLPQVAFNDLDGEAQARWSKEMTHTSTALFTSPSAYEPWAQGTKCGYIFCREDNALPLPIQEQMAAQLGPDPATVTLKAGHCPFLSIPDQLVEAIQNLEARLQ